MARSRGSYFPVVAVTSIFESAVEGSASAIASMNFNEPDFGFSAIVMLVGAGIMVPLILAYTAYSYWIFRGKTGHEGYH